MRTYLTRRMLVLAAAALVVLAAGGYFIYLALPGWRWLGILLFVLGAGTGVSAAVFAHPRPQQDPPGRED